MFNYMKSFTGVDRFIGRKFFYADEETGVGWESKIDDITRDFDYDAITLHLSCGTEVKINCFDILKNNERAFFTNLKETNDN